MILFQQGVIPCNQKKFHNITCQSNITLSSFLYNLIVVTSAGLWQYTILLFKRVKNVTFLRQSVHKLHIIWVTFRNVLYVDNKCVLFIVWCKFCANIIILIIYYGHRQQCQLDEIRLPAPECIRAYHNRLLPVLPLFFSCSIFERLNQVWKFIRLWLITTTISSYRRFAL